MGADKGAVAAENTDIFSHVEAQEFEHRFADGNDLTTWDMRGWVGSDVSKLAFKAKGALQSGAGLGGRLEQQELQLLYRRIISPFFDLQAGLRHDFRPHPSRSYAVVGVQGLAPQWVELDASLFASDEGDISGRLGAEYELLITRKLLLRGATEVNFAFSDDRATGIASGVNDIEFGLRLAYAVRRKFTPYVGMVWEKQFGGTADLAQEEGEADDRLFFVTGVRFFF